MYAREIKAMYKKGQSINYPLRTGELTESKEPKKKRIGEILHVQNARGKMTEAYDR